MQQLTNAQKEALDQLLSYSWRFKRDIEIRKAELNDIPNNDSNVGGGRSNVVSKQTELIIERWDSDKRLKSLEAKLEALEKTLDTLDEELTKIFWLRWSRGSMNSWESIAALLGYSRSAIYNKRTRILEIFADFYGFI